MWVQTKEPCDQAQLVVSRYYIEAGNSKEYPVMVIDIDKVGAELNAFRVSILVCNSDNMYWSTIRETPGWMVSEIEELLKLAKEKLN